MSLAKDADIRETGCPYAAFPLFFSSGWFVRISLLRWFSERWAFSVSFFPIVSTSGRKQAIVGRWGIQIVRRDGENDKKTKEQKSKR